MVSQRVCGHEEETDLFDERGSSSGPVLEGDAVVVDKLVGLFRDLCDAHWPVWGLPVCIHLADSNATRSCVRGEWKLIDKGWLLG